MNDLGKSDGCVVPAKLPNNAGVPVAEAVEGRRPAEGNAASKTRPGLRAGTGAPSALDRVRDRAVQDKGTRFTALLHHVDVDRLRTAYWAINPRAASGVDDVTWSTYAQDLEGNLQDLHRRVHCGGYRAKPTRRAYIPKHDGRLRPLGIAALEDKILQRAVVEVLNGIYETDFVGFSYGFRPGRSAHDALDALAAGIYDKKVNWVLDADIRDFLEPSSHCLSAAEGGVEQGAFGLWGQYSQAFSASVADVEGLQFAALDTLQHGLAGDAEGRALRRRSGRSLAGASSTNRARSWSLTRIRHGAPGVSCSPAMNPACSQRWSVEAATPSWSAALLIGSSSPSGGSVGGW